ncbi:MAG: DUF2208 domain-containing protein [Fervidicoccaceae archaeon]
MSYPQMSTKKQVLISQLSILIFALIAGLVGRGGTTYWILVLLYFIVFTYIMMRISRPKQQAKVDVAKIESGKILLEEKNTYELMSQDKEYMAEVSEQMRIAQQNMLLMFPVMIYFFIAYGPITNTIPSYFENHRLGVIVAFLVLFEGSFVLSRLGQWYIERRLKKRGYKPVMINAPRGYLVTSEGIVMYGLAGKQAISFPVKGYKLNYNVQRKFVELIQETDKGIMKLRFYTKSPEKLFEILKRKVEE